MICTQDLQMRAVMLRVCCRACTIRWAGPSPFSLPTCSSQIFGFEGSQVVPTATVPNRAVLHSLGRNTASSRLGHTEIYHKWTANVALNGKLVFRWSIPGAIPCLLTTFYHFLFPQAAVFHPGLLAFKSPLPTCWSQWPGHLFKLCKMAKASVCPFL